MITEEHRIAVVSGSAGVICRAGNDLIVLGGGGAAVAAATDAIAMYLAPNASRGADLVAELGLLSDVAIAALVDTPAGFQTIATGNGTVERIDGRDLLWVGIGPAPSDAIARTEQAPHVDLTGGVVPGHGALVVGPTAPTEPSFEVMDLQAPTAERPAPLPVAEASAAPVTGTDPTAEQVGELPVDPPSAPPADPVRAVGGSQVEVMGIRCSRNHFNNPRAAYCQVCGISMVHVTHYLVPGQRPTLGFLVFDDGATFALDRSYRLGREPSADGPFTPLVLHDDRHSVSRSHAEIELDGWTVAIRDLASTNGTFIWDSGQQQWHRVMPDQSVMIEPGTSVAIGRRVFVYEAVARSV